MSWQIKAYLTGSLVFLFGLGPVHGSGTHVDTGYYFSEWKEADGQCECGHPSTSQITPGAWSVTPSLSIPIAFLEITFGYTDDPPDPVSISCVPGTCSRNKALYYTMTTDRLIHWKGTKLVQCTTGGTFSQCYAEWDIHCKSQDISSGYQLTWASSSANQPYNRYFDKAPN